MVALSSMLPNAECWTPANFECTGVVLGRRWLVVARVATKKRQTPAE